MNNTPSSERLHITVFGKRNTGKSSLVNSITGQKVALVSDTPGTTTDPVHKAMEIPGIGPCLFTDTAGFDDDAAELGDKRIGLTAKALEKTDIALMIFRDCDAVEKEWYEKLKGNGIPVIPVINKTGSTGPGSLGLLKKDILAICKDEPLTVNALTGEGTDSIIRAVQRRLPEDYGHQTITGNLVKKGDTVLLVMPQDIQAPKGRLILPQVQTLRELLDKECTVVSCTAGRIKESLAGLAAHPDLIITDSQVFQEVVAAKPAECRLTSFSVLFAAYKGDINAFTEGARALEHLNGNSRILIAEACTHAPASEDIGRVKIPRMLRQRFGDGLRIDIVGGTDFPDDLSPYSLIIHCGACMFNRRYVLSRIAAARKQGIPITNYGIAIAWLKGILDKVALP
ncbi:MAG: [FeFe] hydrogenase H-cluster maturation GTPase HydF [Bacteroidetes bacterium]|uniref:[FeFe] hydrogenase H-cluster maturation GTPase HydF n=1 Tax=Candidatus Cryptobacteroides avicola TaxID=2840757 RepID=A0A940II20_9BACT|nr:[FeFe] hydrogenase H-cluster maturation GTPase HydF [Candidatus Cryptobacteroides avicola]